MKRVTLSSEVERSMLQGYWAAPKFYNYGLLEYYKILGWDIHYESSTQSYNIPEDQVTFFLLSL